MTNDETGKSDLQRELEEIERQKRERTEQFLKVSADVSRYETYDGHYSRADSRLAVLSARVRGKQHIKESKPCQDYCMTVELEGVTILTCADGVSKCINSETGSKLACEAAIRVIAETVRNNRSEADLVRATGSPDFKERILACWVGKLLRYEGFRRFSEQPDIADRYGSTLMFAIITPEHYICGITGDGQIGLLADDKCFTLRAHGNKERTVKCLTTVTCAREFMLVRAYPRRDFDGVLLTTDGLYDTLNSSILMADFAGQLCARALSDGCPEPKLPFCYCDSDGRTKDLAEFFTFDDCSYAAAFDISPEKSIISEDEKMLAVSCDRTLLYRYSENCRAFAVEKAGKVFEAVLKRDTGTLHEIPELSVPDVKFLTPDAEECADGMNISYYSDDDEGFQPLEQLYWDRVLSSDRHDPMSSCRRIVQLYARLNHLCHELEKQGLSLDDSAVFLLMSNGSEIHVIKEAVNKGTAPVPDVLNALFSNLYGIAVNETEIYPLMLGGYDLEGETVLDSEDNMLMRLYGREDSLLLQNLSQTVWKLPDGKEVPFGKAFSLSEHTEFEADGEHFKIVKKESL